MAVTAGLPWRLYTVMRQVDMRHIQQGDLLTKDSIYSCYIINGNSVFQAQKFSICSKLIVQRIPNVALQVSREALEKRHRQGWVLQVVTR